MRLPSLLLASLAVLTLRNASADSSLNAPYPNGLPSDPSFFPIAVWDQSSSHAPHYKAMGINTYIALSDNLSNQALTQLRNNGMFLLAEQDPDSLRFIDSKVIKGWIQPDEPDDAQPDGKGGYGGSIPATDVVQRARDLKAKDPTRPAYVNFGNGVAAPGWYGRGSSTGDTAYYDTAVQESDILCFDIYPTSLNPAEHVERGRLQYIAEGVSSLMKRIKPNQQVWCWLEAAALDPQRPVKPASLHTETWMALISGASGIGYFVHEFKPQFLETGILHHPGIVAEVTKQDKEITALAPVLNSPTLRDALTVDSPIQLATMVKKDADNLYVFTVALENKPGVVHFTLKDPAVSHAEVLDENRAVDIQNGQWQDAYPGYGVHLYKIPLKGP